MYKSKILPMFTLSVFSLAMMSSHADTTIKRETILIPSKHDISMPLRDIPGQYNIGVPAKLRNRVAETSLVPLTFFEGLGSGIPGYVVKSIAPNVNGFVGSNQYLQWVDPDIGVFDKNTGVLLPGFPKPGNSIWAGFGGPCETQNIGAPNIKYDQIAKRWILARQAYVDQTTGPFYQCMAVSVTEDATGSWYRYSFQMDSYNDYGKMALWGDGYYLALHMFGPVSFGPRACALNRSEMLLGLPTVAQCKQLTDAESGPILAADLSGSNYPPAGTPALFFSIAAPSDILIYKFHTDWTNPANTNISTVNSIPVRAYVKPCPSTAGMNCAIQPDTATRLDLLGDRFSSRIRYRQFPGWGSIVLTHNVEGTPPKFSPAVRWYELRWDNQPDTYPVVYQQGTIQIDSKARFTGAIAIDKYQNIALAYTVSSSLVHPSPEMAYRNYYEPLNTMRIQPLWTSMGSQTGNSAWSIYAMMALDPFDGCSFWYTGEYQPTDGTYNWGTIVEHFKLAACK